MTAPQYGLVAYVKLGHLPAHLSILPPRLLQGSEEEALTTLERLCDGVAPFQVTLDGVDSFRPITPTVFLRVETAAPMHQLHDRLNTAALAANEQWSYTPHLTIVKLADEGRLLAAQELARKRWEAYRGPRRTRVEELTFVREGESASQWTDLASVRLGRALASQSRG